VVSIASTDPLIFSFFIRPFSLTPFPTPSLPLSSSFCSVLQPRPPVSGDSQNPNPSRERERGRWRAATAMTGGGRWRDGGVQVEVTTHTQNPRLPKPLTRCPEPCERERVSRTGAVVLTAAVGGREDGQRRDGWPMSRNPNSPKLRLPHLIHLPLLSSAHPSPRNPSLHSSICERKRGVGIAS